jgi:hypothetical protein
MEHVKRKAGIGAIFYRLVAVFSDLLFGQSARAVRMPKLKKPARKRRLHDSEKRSRELPRNDERIPIDKS